MNAAAKYVMKPITVFLILFLFLMPSFVFEEAYASPGQESKIPDELLHVARQLTLNKTSYQSSKKLTKKSKKYINLGKYLYKKKRSSRKKKRSRRRVIKHCSSYGRNTLENKAARYASVIYMAAQKYRLSPSLIKAVITAESCFNPYAKSPKGAKGLMQLMPATGRRFGAYNRTNVFENIMAGSKYLRFLLNRYQGNMRFAVAAYNAGEGRVDRYKGIPPYRETKNYVRQVMRTYRKLGSGDKGKGRLLLKARSKARHSILSNNGKSCRMARPHALNRTAYRQRGRNGIQYFRYQVRLGENLYHVQKRTGVSLRQLMDMNQLRNTRLRFGQNLIVWQCRG